MALSNAIDQSALAKVVGYGLGFRDFSSVTPNLPQRIAIFSPIEQSKQAGFTDWNKRITVTTVEDVLNLFGICPAYYCMRILKPVSGGGIGSIPIDVFPIQETTGVKSTGDLTITGTATKTINHTIVFNGRKFVDGSSITYTVETGDSPDDVKTKIIAAVNGFSNSPVVASDGGVGIVTLDSKWQTLTANEISLTIDIGNDQAGLVYALPTFANGAGAFDISTALNNFGDIWTTLVINCFDSTLFDVFADFNGIPDPDTGGTGRWNAKVAKPFISFTGSNESSKTTLLAISASRKTDLTNSLAVGPNSPGFTFEIAANIVGVFGLEMNNDPHSTAAEKFYFDLPGPSDSDIGDMQIYDNRDQLVKGGVSTCTYDESNGYRIEDLVTFRRPDSQPELAKDWRYCRDILGIDFNVIFKYRIIEETYLLNKTIANDNDVIAQDVSKDVVKPKDWRAQLFDLFDELVSRALIADAQFSKDSLQVAISQVNPNRFETTFNYKRTGTVRISSTTAYAGFNFG